jgi:hypothetical protein
LLFSIIRRHSIYQMWSKSKEKNSQKVVIIFPGAFKLRGDTAFSHIFSRFTWRVACALSNVNSQLTAPLYHIQKLNANRRRPLKNCQGLFNTIKQGVFEHFFIQKPLVL